jgi:hypothetical protein
VALSSRFFASSVLAPIEIIDDEGRTCVVLRLREGLVWKAQRTGVDDDFLREISNAFNVKHALLQRLGYHPGTVRWICVFACKSIHIDAKC